MINGVKVVFNDDSTSRLQCSIVFENNSWFLMDSDGSKKTMNGTWYLADEFIRVKSGMNIRAGTTTFEALIYNSD